MLLGNHQFSFERYSLELLAEMQGFFPFSFIHKLKKRNAGSNFLRLYVKSRYFRKLGVFYSGKTVCDGKKLITFLDSVRKSSPETCAHCPETFGTQNFVGLCDFFDF